MLKTEILSKDHDRKGFDCGSDALNSYLKKTARQHIDKGIAKTFVIVDDARPGEILGSFVRSQRKICRLSTQKNIPRKFRLQNLAGLQWLRTNNIAGWGVK